MRPQRSLTAFADPSRQLATFQRRSHRRGILLLKAHSHRFANQTRQPREGEGRGKADGVDGCSPLLSLFPGEIIMGILSLKCQRLRKIAIDQSKLIFPIIYIYIYISFLEVLEVLQVLEESFSRKYRREVIRPLEFGLSFFLFL